jgi:hypothetical protein
METVRIELGDGDYAVVGKEVKHKTSVALEKLLRNSVSPDDWVKLQAQLKGEPDIIKRMAILDKIEVEGDDIINLVNQTEELVIDGKPQPITVETFDNMSSAKYETLKNEVNKLYSPVPLVPNK